MPSILHVTEPVDGGVAKVVVDLAHDQVGRGWRVGVASPVFPPFHAAAASAGADVIPWPIAPRPVDARAHGPSRTSALRGLRLLRGVINSFEPDLVHLHASLAGLVGRLAIRRSRPTIFQPHGWSFEIATGTVARGAAAWEKVATRLADAIVCVSDGERRAAQRVGIRRNVVVIHNGVVIGGRPVPSAEERRDARAAFGLAADEPCVVCVGALRRVKGQDVLLAAWPRVRERVPNARLLIAGDGPLRGLLAAIPSAADGVLFLGARRDVDRVLAASDVVAIPSRSEGMSLVMLEAMASGRSIVATDVPGAEAVAGAGAVVPPRAPVPLAEALIERLLDRELAEREGAAARRRAERDYDFARTSKQLADVYSSVLRKRHRGVDEHVAQDG